MIIHSFLHPLDPLYPDLSVLVFLMLLYVIFPKVNDSYCKSVISTRGSTLQTAVRLCPWPLLLSYWPKHLPAELLPTVAQISDHDTPEPRNPVVPTLLSSLLSALCVVLILSHVSFHFSDAWPSSASRSCRSCSSLVMASGAALLRLSQHGHTMRRRVLGPALLSAFSGASSARRSGRPRNSQS